MDTIYETYEQGLLPPTDLFNTVNQMGKHLQNIIIDINGNIKIFQHEIR